jgi:hypothetical protein
MIKIYFRHSCEGKHYCGENTSYSAMLNIPELVPPWNQSQQFRESVPTNSYHTRNQLPLIPTDSRNRLQFRRIPESHDHRTIPLLHYRHMHPIPERNSGNWFRFRNCTEFREFLPIPEFLTGIGSSVDVEIMIE